MPSDEDYKAMAKARERLTPEQMKRNREEFERRRKEETLRKHREELRAWINRWRL